MYIIAGLGNPGKEYEHTRHNVGFDTIDYMAKKHGIDVREAKFKALIGKGVIAGQKVVLLKPLTYMNLSGESIRQAMDFYKIDPEQELIVISDDISLEVGMIRIRKKGSAGGHNGLKNIILHSGTEGFSRVKIGVGEKPQGRDLVGHVLGRFAQNQRKAVEDSIADASDAIELMINGDTDRAMNAYNKKNNQTEQN